MNASNLKYRNRLKRRVMITRQQLYQPSPLHDHPRTTDDDNGGGVSGSSMMVHRYERRGGGGDDPIVSKSNHPTNNKEQQPPQQHWIQPQQTTHPPKRQYSNTNNAAPPSTKPAPSKPTAQHHQQQYSTVASPPEGQGDISRTLSMLTDEVMQDRNSMIRNVVNLEKRMQLKRQEQSGQQQSKQQPKESNHQQQQQQQSNKQRQHQQPKNDNTKQSLKDEGDNHIVDLVNEAIAINVGMTNNNKKKRSPLRSFQSLAISAKNDFNSRLGNNNSMMSTMTTTTTTTPNYKSTPKAVVTPDAPNPNPPLPPSSSSPEEEEGDDLPPSPAPTDHSADAAAGMMMFAVQKKKKKKSSSARKKIVDSVMVKTEEQERKKEIIRNEESRPSGADTNTTTVGPSPRIVSPSSKEDNNPPSPSKSTTNPTPTPPRHPHHPHLNLEQKLVRLTTKNNHSSPIITTTSSPIHGSSKVSVVSVTPSIESECVRQNAEILLAMEDAMMDFMGGGGGVDGGGDGLATVQSVDDNGDDDDIDEDEGDVLHTEERLLLNEATTAEKTIGTREEALLVSPQNQSSTLFSLEEQQDESDDYADPPLMSSDDSNNHSDVSPSSSSRSGSGFTSDEQQNDDDSDGEEFVIAERKEGKDLGTFFDQLSSMFGVRCALDRDEDSDIFYINNSQFNTSVFSAAAEIEEMNQKRMIDDARKEGVVPTIHNAESFCGESHTTMPRGNTTKQREDQQLAYLSPPREVNGPAIQFARHDIDGNVPPDPDLSLEIDDDDIFDDDDDIFDDAVDAEGDCLPDPEEGSGADDGKGGRDPPRGIDPEEGEGVSDQNHFQKQRILPNASAALTLDHVKTTTREKNKSSSLHWQSSNGLILDDEMNAKKLCSIRAKTSEKIESTSTIPPSISTNTTILQEHFVENEHKLSPNYRRRAGGHLQFIDEVEDEDDDPSVGEESDEGPQYDYEQFVEEFKEVVQKDPEPIEPEPVEELVIGSISESSSLKDEEVDFDLLPKSKPPQNVTQKREMEAAIQRSMRQATSNRQRKYLQHVPQPELVQSHYQGQQQQRQTTQSSVQPIHRNAVKQPSVQAAYAHQYNHEQPKAAKTRLEEKLQGLGAPTKLSGDSVGTSELGSLYSASFAAGVPKTIVQRPNPPPSSMQNVANQGTRQHALNTLSRGLTPDFSSQEPLRERGSTQPGSTAAKGDRDGFADSKDTLGFIPIGSETWKLKHEFLDSSPLDPPPRRSPLGFFPSSIDETSQVSDGFGRLNNNTLGSLQVGKETWKLKYDFHDTPAKGNAPFNPPQPQEFERRQQQHPEPLAPPQVERRQQQQPEPVAPPTVNRYRQKIPLRPVQPVRSDSSNRYSPKKLVMKSETKNRAGTQVHSLHFVGVEDSPSPKKPSSPRARLLSGKKKLFQSLPSAVKVVRQASSPRSQRVSRVVKESNESLLSNQPVQEQSEAERRRNQAAHIESRLTTKDPMPTRPTVNRSLEDKLRSVDPPSSEKTKLAEEAEVSQISGSVFEAVEVGSFGVQHTLFSKWDKQPKDSVNRQPSVQPHPYQSQPPPPQRQPQYKSVSYISTFNGKQDQVVYKLPNLGRFRRKK